jgi:murein DD-endopeptidase MepM/ murein hydrolase activator NlpD
LSSLRTTRLPFIFPILLLCVMAQFAIILVSAPSTVHAAPQLILPTPPGEDWVIIQGYACGTHNAWDRYSLDLVQVDGPTYNAPIRAAAAGTIWYWGPQSGTIILSHGDDFFTMYTHMSSAVSTAVGHAYAAGDTLGYAGDRGSRGTPHLHFTAFTANRDGWSGKQSVPLHFAEGYDLPEIGGCSQHQGTVLTASALQDPQVTFTGSAQIDAWYNSDQRVEFTTEWAGGGLSQAWNVEPTDDAPMFPQNIDGYASLSDAGEGMHTLYVRVWGPDGRQTLASYGPVGYDVTPPNNPPTLPELQAVAGTPLDLSWEVSNDSFSGVSGYRVYVGLAEDGSDQWFTEEPAITTPPLSPGRYVLRVQTLDNAGNTSNWATIRTIIVE